MIVQPMMPVTEIQLVTLMVVISIYFTRLAKFDRASLGLTGFDFSGGAGSPPSGSLPICSDSCESLSLTEFDRDWPKRITPLFFATGKPDFSPGPHLAGLIGLDQRLTGLPLRRRLSPSDCPISGHANHPAGLIWFDLV